MGHSVTCCMDWKSRRNLANQLYKYSDNNLQYTVEQSQTDQQLTDQVIDFFVNGSQLIYPAKYIFCNIVYCHFLSKYFNLDFYKQLDDKDTLPDSPMYCTYSDRKTVYDNVLSKILVNIESYDSISKTRKYFKQEFLIMDEDLSDIL